MQTWDKDIQRQLNNLHSFPRKQQWELGDWIDECHVRPEVADVASLPATDNEIGDVRVCAADQSWYFWNGITWVPMGTGGSGPILSVTGVAPISLWVVMRVLGDLQLLAYKHPSKHTKLYEIRLEGDDDVVVFQVGGSGQQVSENLTQGPLRETGETSSLD